MVRTLAGHRGAVVAVVHVPEFHQVHTAHTHTLSLSDCVCVCVSSCTLRPLLRRNMYVSFTRLSRVNLPLTWTLQVLTGSADSTIGVWDATANNVGLLRYQIKVDVPVYR